MKRYRSGQCTERELEIIDNWYQSFESDGANATNPLDGIDPEKLKMEMFEHINSKIDVAGSDGALMKDNEGRRRGLYLYHSGLLSRIAAVLVVGVALGIFYFRDVRHGNMPSLSGSNANAVAQQIEVSEPSTVYLADGSVVWLKEGSTLEYPETFQGSTREVKLAGEAFFDVAKNPDKPFIIHSANFTTRVVGTSFNIRAYRNDASAEVVVVTGKVVVSVKEPRSEKVKEVVLHPNQRVVYSRSTHSLMEPAPVADAKAIAMDKHKLAFDDTRLADIVRVLNATYGVNISLSSESMNDCVITADLTNENLEFAMIILAKAINATYTISGKDILLRGNGCGL